MSWRSVAALLAFVPATAAAHGLGVGDAFGILLILALPAALVGLLVGTGFAALAVPRGWSIAFSVAFVLVACGFPMFFDGFPARERTVADYAEFVLLLGLPLGIPYLVGYRLARRSMAMPSGDENTGVSPMTGAKE